MCVCVCVCVHVKFLEVCYEPIKLSPYEGSILLKLLLYWKKTLPRYHGNQEDSYRKDQPGPGLASAYPSLTPVTSKLEWGVLGDWSWL